MRKTEKPAKQEPRIVAAIDIYGPVLHGEGPLCGRPSIMMQCAEPAPTEDPDEMTVDDAFGRILDLSAGFPTLMTLCGARAASVPARLLDLAKDKGYSVALECAGTTAQDWFCLLDFLIISPRVPSRGGVDFNANHVRKCVAAANPAASGLNPILKLSIYDDADYEFARDVADVFPELLMWLQPCVPTPAANALTDQSSRLIALRSDILRRVAWLAERVHRDHWSSVTVLPQLHVLLEGNKRGV